MLAHRDPLDANFAALADPTRRAILARLAQGHMHLDDLAQPFGISAFRHFGISAFRHFGISAFRARRYRTSCACCSRPA